MTKNSTQPTDRKYDDLFNASSKKKLYFVCTRKRKFQFVQYLYRVPLVKFVQVSSKTKHEIIPTISCSAKL